MAKYKNISGAVQRFDLDYKEKIVDVNSRFTAEPNAYLIGAVTMGIFEVLEEPEDQPAPAVAAVATDSPKPTRN